ncbi:hypothetical protein [Planobispora longispora]|uniref:Uncharacterized protein n=1 Tax=Planobispora longispora TaxID=28887 RepID=A0A8J3RUY7_9ACTN|nr:hypothetical protein [Planobispora longispora]BFE79197.1 hypothetical protein GCM10020093_017980 [Planobispora longispora]GIH80019.1 hypothetical protein Plo01_64480 [Planobispora longispora]
MIIGGLRREPRDGGAPILRVPTLYEPLVADAAENIRKWMDHGIPHQ